MSALDDIAAERVRQLDEKGFDADHDDGYTDGELAQAAAAYAYPIEADGLLKDATHDDRRGQLLRAGALVAAEIDRLDRAKAGVPQAYLPKAVCWERRPIQCAIAVREKVIEFCGRHPHLRVFSGLRIGSTGDHRCGYATDLVPLDYADKGDVVNAFVDASLMLERGLVAYVEPLSATWIPGNHHLHVSWRRCP